MQYRIYNSHGVPQCGCEVLECATWEDVERYFEDEGNMEDLALGYARIEEVC